MQQAAAEPCRHPRAIKFRGHVVAFQDGQPPSEVTEACPDCQHATDAQGISGYLAAPDAASITRLAVGCALMREAVVDGRNLSALDDDLPSPIWYPRLGLTPSIEPHTLLPHPVLSDSSLLRIHARSHFGRTDATSTATIQTPVGPVQVGDVYENHFFDVDPGTGKDRRDPDHVFSIPLVPETLTRPIEVWEVQDGGRRSRRLIFFKLYLLEDRWAYHLAVTTRDRKLLTAHRIKGLSACQGRRRGCLRFMAY
jgi:hypothetical protein